MTRLLKGRTLKQKVKEVANLADEQNQKDITLLMEEDIEYNPSDLILHYQDETHYNLSIRVGDETVLIYKTTNRINERNRLEVFLSKFYDVATGLQKMGLQVQYNPTGEEEEFEPFSESEFLKRQEALSQSREKQRERESKAREEERQRYLRWCN